MFKSCFQLIYFFQKKKKNNINSVTVANVWHEGEKTYNHYNSSAHNPSLWLCCEKHIQNRHYTPHGLMKTSQGLYAEWWSLLPRRIIALSLSDQATQRSSPHPSGNGLARSWHAAPLELTNPSPFSNPPSAIIKKPLKTMNQILSYMHSETKSSTYPGKVHYLRCQKGLLCNNLQ